jgi:alpha-glucosidase
MTMMNSDSIYGLNSDPLYQSHPFYLALRAGTAYGIFFDNTFRSEFDVAKSIGDQVKFMAAGGEVDYWVLAGPTPKDVLGNYSALIGRMPLPPLWGIGYHQCRYSYKTAQRVREIRDGFKENKIPVDAIYLDIHYMDDYRVFTFNSQTFPDPAGLVSELLADGIKTVVIVDPGIKIDPNYAVFNQCVSMKCYCTDPEGKPFVARVWPKEVYFPDFYRPETRTWWGDQHKFYTDLGIAGIWNDMNELAGWKRDIRLLGMSLGWGTVDWSRMRHGDEMVPHARIRNVYALLEAESTYDGLLRLRPEKRPFVISRAGYPGLQRYSLIWTGDNASTWGQLAMAVPMQLNLGLSGQPFVGADIGGFLGAPSPELFARWIEQGTFSPFCRNHTAVNMPNQEPWAFNDQVTAISRDAINLRYRLLPYTYSLFEEASRTGWPIMRAMPFEFPADERVTGIQDQYMWGEALMVAPVVAKGAIRRPVYFPAGDWYDWYSGKKFTGPAEIEVETPLARAPIFARGGAIVPLGPAIMHTNEKPLDPLTLVVFPGAAASSFSLYEDAGEGFGYREGDYARTELKSRPIAGGLEIQVGPRAGKFDPRRANVELKVYGLGPEVQVSMTSIEGQELPSPAATFDRAESAWLIRLGDEPAGRVIKMAAK